MALESPWIVNGPDLEAAESQRGAERHAEQDHRERPDDVQATGDHGVRPAPEVARNQAEGDREQRS